MKCRLIIYSLLLLLFASYGCCQRTTKLARGNKPKHINKTHLLRYIKETKGKYKVPNQILPKKVYK